MICPTCKSAVRASPNQVIAYGEPQGLLVTCPDPFHASMTKEVRPRGEVRLARLSTKDT